MFTPWVASRYLFSRHAGRFAPLLTAVSVGSVAVAMLSLIVVLSIMRGFRTELSERLLGFNAHITLTQGALAPALDRSQVAALFADGVLREASPFVQGEVIAQSEGSGELLAQGARVRGIEPEAVGHMQRLQLWIPPQGSASPLLERGSGHSPALVGNDMAVELAIHPDFGDALDLIAPMAELLPNGELGPNRRTYAVTGVFRTGIFEYDSKWVLLPLAEAERLLGEQAGRGWLVRLSSMGEMKRALAAVRGSLPEGWRAEGWNEQNRKLFAALALERIAMGGVLLMVVGIASCSIMGVVLLVTASKRKDMAILEAVGLRPLGVGKVFVCHAAMIGGVGSAIGLIFGLAACFALARWPIALPDSYYLDVLPVEVDPAAAAGFALLGIAVAICSAIVPVRRAVRLDPIEVLRYE